MMKYFTRSLGAAVLSLFLVSCAEDEKEFDFEPDSTAFAASDDVSEKLKVEEMDRVYFDFDSSDLNSEGVALLNRQISWLRESNIKAINVEGHCDERGTREYNLGLGERRANSVANYIRQALPDVQINVISYGKDKPVLIEQTGLPISEIYRLNRVVITTVG